MPRSIVRRLPHTIRLIQKLSGAQIRLICITKGVGVYLYRVITTVQYVTLPPFWPDMVMMSVLLMLLR